MSHRQPLWVVRQSEGKGRRTGEEGERSLVPFLACPWHSCFFVRDPFSSARNQSQGSGIIGFCERAMIIGALFFGSFYPWSFTCKNLGFSVEEFCLGHQAHFCNVPLSLFTRASALYQPATSVLALWPFSLSSTLH